jgi:hypothetical protein
VKTFRPESTTAIIASSTDSLPGAVAGPGKAAEDSAEGDQTIPTTNAAIDSLPSPQFHPPEAQNVRPRSSTPCQLRPEREEGVDRRPLPLNRNRGVDSHDRVLRTQGLGWRRAVSGYVERTLWHTGNCDAKLDGASDTAMCSEPMSTNCGDRRITGGIGEGQELERSAGFDHCTSSASLARRCVTTQERCRAASANASAIKHLWSNQAVGDPAAM